MESGERGPERAPAPPPGRVKVIMLRTLKKWFRNEKGVVAIEFAMVALPFFMLLMGIIEVSMFYASSIILEGGASEASRLIRTGEAQGTADPEGDFKTELCFQVEDLIPCNLIQYEVIVMPNDKFADVANFQPQFDASGNFVPAGFNPGGSCDVVLIRTVYKYNFMMPFIGNMMNGGVGNNPATLMSTMVIKNEPYTGITSC